MQLLATSEQMQGFDRVAIGKLLIPGLLLMENAGRGFVEELEKAYGSLAGSRVAVVCGKGNNGGDGFVIARHLLNRGCSVDILLPGSRRELKGDAKTNFASVARVASARSSGLSLVEGVTPRRLSRLRPPDIIVDAIFGTGFTGSVKGPQLGVIAWINGEKSYVASVDIPSGVDATTGIVGNVAVRANLTVTMGLAKIGHFVGAGREHAGTVAVVDIGIPRITFRPGAAQSYRIEEDDVARCLPQRPLTAHKYSVGKVFVLAGSRHFTGAPVMTALSVLRAGAGAVILGVPQCIHAPLVKKLTEVIMAPLPETPEGSLSGLGREVIREHIAWADAVAIGPGLSRNSETDNLVLGLIPEIRKPLIIDADALNALASDVSILRRRRDPTILTPHTGELGRLTGKSSHMIEPLRVEAARSAASALTSIIVLKGSPTVTAVPGGETFLNSTGNPGMATIGSGDVLTGTVSGFCAQGMSPAEAAYAGVFVHGLAGDLAARRYGQRSLLATDILEHIPQALNLISR